ncbi:hypothetical protein CO683_38985 [Bradyrhizobium ottawaense]|uniref:hypothetical protein n=1 Tax=Bradyrhizobium TaxID=374 RepID=UPI000BEA20F8|nr:MULTISPECIES: hypothetical protein [Bradyrhizobium]MDA9504015.1 hypothetical protein [Bradyrhizobium sp. CCBAU 11386]MDA9534778.1 hypothetical protein [Bradyrhizobium sp. CCBAU 21362]PDT64296.1 hypothetical protein CO683_38985 [Bradyrhizobium ottawaense]
MSSPKISTQSTAAADRDLIFVVIERHRELSAHYDAALSVSAKIDGREFDAADEISSQKNHALAEHANVLIRSRPTTIAGVIALIRYVGSLREWELPDDDAWYGVFLKGLADAIDGIAMAQRLGRDGD